MGLHSTEGTTFLSWGGPSVQVGNRDLHEDGFDTALRFLEGTPDKTSAALGAGPDKGWKIFFGGVLSADLVWAGLTGLGRMIRHARLSPMTRAGGLLASFPNRPAPRLVTVFVPLFLGVLAAPEFAAGQGATDASEVVERFVRAFNAHDVEAMLGLVTRDIELRYADEEGVFSQASSTADELGRDMRAYFATRPEVRSEIDGMVGGERFVSFRERIVGGDSSLAVYEIQEGLIRRAWYYPAEKAPGQGR